MPARVSPWPPDGKTLASITGALLQRWDVETGKPLYPDTSELGHTSAVCGVVFAPNGRGIVTIGADETIRYWDLSTRRPRTLFTGICPRYGGGTASARSPDSERDFFFAPQILAIMADSRRLLSETRDQQLRLTDIQTGKELRRFDVRNADNNPSVGAVRLSADGRMLWTLPHHSPDITGGLMAIARKETLIGWDMASGRRLSSHDVAWCGDLRNNVIAPDGRSVALESNSVRDVVGGRKRLREEQGLSYPYTFSVDSRLVAAADLRSQDRWDTIAVHELLTGRRLSRLDAPISWSSRFAFSPDGRLLIAAGADALHVWEVSSGRRLLHLPTKERLPDWTLGAFATCLAVAPDGRSVATGHEDGTVLLWDLAPAWRRLAKRPAVALTDAQLDICWADLLRNEPLPAYAAMDRLTANPERAIALLRKRLRPVTIDSHWLERRLADLDSSEFATREKATRDLEAIAEAIEPRLRQAMAKGASLEVRRRLQGILEISPPLVPPAETVRRLRAVAVLERLATAEARALLRELAKGEAGHRLTRAATAALAR